MASVSESLVYYLTSNGPIAAVIGDRIESDSLSQGVAVPAIVYRCISTGYASDIDGTVLGMARSRYEIDCIADTRAAADSLAKLVRDSGMLAWQRKEIQGVLFQGVLIDSGVRHFTEQPDPGDHRKRYVASMDFQFSYSET